MSSITYLIFGANEFCEPFLEQPNLWGFASLSPLFYGVARAFEYLWNWDWKYIALN